MPVRPENRSRYPSDWKALTVYLKGLRQWQCEGSPAHPDCRADHGQPHPFTGSRVVLTVAHLDHQPENCDLSNLRVWCQRCHNTYDAPMRAAGIKERKMKE